MSHWDFITHNTLLKRIKHNLKEVKQKEFEVWNHRATGRTRMQLGLGKFGSRNWKATKIHIFPPLVLLERWLYCFSTTEQQPQLSRSHIYVQLPRFTSPSSLTKKNLCSCFSFSSRLYENRTHFFLSHLHTPWAIKHGKREKVQCKYGDTMNPKYYSVKKKLKRCCSFQSK